MALGIINSLKSVIKITTKEKQKMKTNNESGVKLKWLKIKRDSNAITNSIIGYWTEISFLQQREFPLNIR